MILTIINDNCIEYNSTNFPQISYILHYEKKRMKLFYTFHFHKKKNNNI